MIAYQKAKRRQDGGDEPVSNFCSSLIRSCSGTQRRPPLRLNRIGSILHSNIVLIIFRCLRAIVCYQEAFEKYTNVRVAVIPIERNMNGMHLERMAVAMAVQCAALCLTHYYKYEILSHLCAQRLWLEELI